MQVEHEAKLEGEVQVVCPNCCCVWQEPVKLTGVCIVDIEPEDEDWRD